LRKRVEKAHSRRIAEHFEDFGGICNKLAVKHLRPHVVNSFLVYAENVTDLTHI
jgi:hypothetical protein